MRETPIYGIAAFFGKRAMIFARRAAIRRTHHIFTAKGTAILGLWCFTRQRTVVQPSKCGTHGGRKAAHMEPCFQVPLRRVCCILFDAYRIYYGHCCPKPQSPAHIKPQLTCFKYHRTLSVRSYTYLYLAILKLLTKIANISCHN